MATEQHLMDVLAAVTSAIERQADSNELIAERLGTTNAGGSKRRTADESAGLALLKLFEDPTLSMRALAEVVGCSAGTLYKHVTFSRIFANVSASGVGPRSGMVTDGGVDAVD